MKSETPLSNGVALRAVAYEALLAWKRGEGFLAESLQKIADRKGLLQPNDRALAWEIALGTLRQIRLLEENLKRFIEHPPQMELSLLLQMGLYQLWWLDRTPPHTVVDAMVELAKSRWGESQVGFVNAVLRKASQEKIRVPKGKRLRDLAVRYSHPDWIVERWSGELDPKQLQLRLKANNSTPTTWVRLSGDPTLRERALRELPLQLSEVRFDRYYPLQGNLRDLLKHPLFLEGAVAVQDPAAWLMVKLLGLQPGDRLLDLCAAPGGKSALVLDEFPGVELVAADLDQRRARLMEDLERRQGKRLARVVADGLHPPFKKGRFSHILLDAPCSNLGVVRRRPEALWKIDPDSLQRLSDLQYRLLCSAASLLSSGGVLVYGTCSPETEESYFVVDKFLKEHPDWSLAPAREYIPRRYLHRHCLRVIPTPGSVDGFFGARLQHRPVGGGE